MNIDPRSTRSSGNSGLWWKLRQAADRTLARRFGARAERLTSAAGSVDGASCFEPLEQRQLLAIVTIPPSAVDPATGLGTVSGWFDYTSPYLFKAIPDPAQGQMPTLEEFADEQANWSMANPALPPNGTYFSQSAFRISYRTQANNAIELMNAAVAGSTGFGDPAMDRDLYVSLQNTDQTTFEFWTGEPMQGQRQTLRITTNVAVTFRTGPVPAGRTNDGDTIKTGANGSRIELLKAGVVVRTLSGTELANALTNLGDGRSIFQFQFQAGFDSFRISAADQNNTVAWSDQFLIDDISTTFPSTRFASFIDTRRFGATFVFTGPAGATVQFLDLYGREIVLDTFLGIPQIGSGGLPGSDQNGDGVPDLNDGIGSIRFTNTNVRTSFTMVGGGPSSVDANGNVQPAGLPNSLAGIGNDLEGMGGFGFTLTNAVPPAVSGVPDGGASFAIGSPIVRDPNDPASYIGNGNGRGDALNQITSANFNRQDQGIFTDGSIGSIQVHAMVFGSSQIRGSIQSLNTGIQYGSINIRGDAGAITIASDAGEWQADDITGLDPRARFTQITGAQLVVGRTVGQINVGGRNAMVTQVLGDINNVSRPALSFIDYAEREVVYAFNPQTTPMAESVFARFLNSTGTFRSRSQAIPGQGLFYGDNTYRNDNLQSAEYVGYNGTAVRIHGNLGAQDPVNGEDFTDVYAFAADPTRELVVQGSAAFAFALNGYVRIVDRNGLTVAALDSGAAGRGNGGNPGGLSLLRFRPDHADVYYLVLNERLNGGFAITTNYDITISGFAPTTVGSLTTGGGVGAPVNNLSLNSGANQFLFTLNAGSLGLLRIGVGFTGGDAAVHNPDDYINTNQNVGDLLDLGTSSISIPVNLYGLVAGSDIAGANISVGRNLGTVVTGGSPLGGGAFGNNLEGDITAGDFRVGGTAGIFDIRGSVAADQDPDPVDSFAGDVSIRTGTAGGKGDIGQILVGGYIQGDQFRVQTSPGSTIDQFLILDNSATANRGDYEIRDGIPTFTLGVGSDLRFADFGLIQRPQDSDFQYIINYNQIYTFIDDAGATYTVSITGGNPATANGSQIIARVLPTDSTQGVALARLNVTLLGGANLNIVAISTSTTGGGGQIPSEAGSVISIGRIIITSDTATSQVLISDAPGVNAEIDVFRIEALNNIALISNTTHGRNDRAGDLVAVDATGLARITVSGNIGLTETNGAGPRLIGPFMGLTGMGMGAVRGPIPVSHAAIDRTFAGGGGDDWDGMTIRVPVQATNYDRPNSLEDVGSPLDSSLNGLIVRAGDLVDVRADGAIGDVVVSGGDLLNLVANANGTRPFGAFEGIIGSIYANSINTIDIGDGLRGTGPSPFAAAGIFANRHINAVNAVRVRGGRIEGVILSADETNAPTTTIGAAGPTQVTLAAPLRGIGSINVTNGFVYGAFIQCVALDDWWVSLRVADQGYITGDIGSINLTTTSLVRSEIQANIVGPITIVGGTYDATTINAIENVASVTADSYLNSTLLGEPSEFHANAITSSRNLGIVTTAGGAGGGNSSAFTGDIADLNIEVLGTLNGRISGRNLLRVNIGVSNVINQITASQDIRASSIVSGRVRNLSVGGNLRNTEMLIAGPIDLAFVTGEISGLRILSSGPDGRIGSFRSNGRFDADISSSGPITLLESVNSDISGTLTTTDTDGNVGTIRAGRDILLDAVITGSVTSVIAVRNLGRAADGNDRALDIQGNLGSLTAGGQIYSDVLVGQSVTVGISSGRASSKPGNDRVGVGDIRVFGRIASLSFTGDLNGNVTSYSGGIGIITITNGTFRQGHTITALDGSIDSITITGGDLLGNIYTDGDLTLLQLLQGADGWRSNIGISRFKSAAVSVDAFRNQLPPDTIRTAAANGPRIFAGHDIGRIFVAAGAVWETTIQAGRIVRDVTINGQFANDELTTGQASAIIAGDRVELVSVSAKSDHVSVASGIIALGEDGVLGGIGSAADTVKQGSIGSVAFNAAGNNNIKVTAGLNAGTDGVYNTADDLLAAGNSPITSVTVRSPSASSAYADGAIGSATGGAGLRVVANGKNLAAAEPDLLRRTKPVGSVAVPSGQSRNFTSPFGQPISVTFSGPGNAWYDPTLNRVVLLNTNALSSLIVTRRTGNRDTPGAALRDFSVVGSNNATVGSLVIRAYLRGNSTIFIDGGIGTLALNRTGTTGTIGSGGDIATFTASRLDSGAYRARTVTAFTVTNTFTGGAATFVDVGTFAVTNAFAGSLSSDHNIAAVNIGAINGGRIRSGGNIGPITAGSTLNGLISARDAITSINVTGDVNDTAIYAGVDLGRDANFGGEGVNTDVISNGTIGPVTVGGSFPKSDLSAGVSRGVDGFLGTSDDVAADGRSSIGVVTIGGRDFGSSINSEQYRVISTGSVGTVTAEGNALVSLNNFSVRQLGALPEPVRVTDINVFEDSRVYRAELRFNQPIDASTLALALSIAEVRNAGQTLVGLAQGSDYTVRYNPVTNIGTITFSRNVTDRNLPQSTGIPGPGLFRFILSGALFRGASQGVMLDGNGDGTTGDDFSQDAVVGDAGDKITAGAASDIDGVGVDFYPAVDLNLLLDSNYNSDNNPDANIAFNVRGTIGDHPDTNSNGFRAGGDVDLYKVSLRAGQILVLGQVGGNARSVARAVFNDAGVQVSGGTNATFSQLPAAIPSDAQATPEDQYLVKVTGTYYIAVASSLVGVDITDTTNVPNNDPVGGAIGTYRFDVTVFDDGNTGFAGDTDAGDGSQVINAPLPIQFAGGDGVFGNGDDVSLFTTGRFAFTLDRGPDNRPNTRDDVVSGGDSDQTTSTRRSGADGIWGNADDEVRSVVRSAIGIPGAIGTPSQISPDADVYRLNGGQVIAAGTRVRFTFKLTDSAGNIGLTPVGAATLANLAGNLGGGFSTSLLGDVQIGLFEVPAGTGFGDAKLVASPSEFVPIGGQRAVTHSDGTNSYGYNADGDFFMEVVLPGAQDVTGANVPASYAFYVQGAVRSDYTLDILTQGTGTVQRSSQNVLLETRGGILTWLEAGGITTPIDAFNSSVLGFAGQINGVDVDDYIIDGLITGLNNTFAAANVDITVSNDAAQFSGSDFSTVFLAGNTEPNAFFNNDTFGASQHVDMLNIDKNDQAVVFAPSLATLGNPPDQAGVDNLVRALTAAVGRRIGELIGLRTTDIDTGASPVSIMASNSVFNNAGDGGTYGFLNATSPLSGLNDTATDTNFFLGAQNSLQLIQRILRPRA